jgi:hypothetical protein
VGTTAAGALADGAVAVITPPLCDEDDPVSTRLTAWSGAPVPIGAALPLRPKCQQRDTDRALDVAAIGQAR